MRQELADAVATARLARTAQPLRFDSCAIWAADIIRDVLGVDPAAAWRGRYTTERGMKRLLGKPGLPKAVRDAMRGCRFRKTDPEEAMAGDIGMLRGPFGPCVVICDGQNFIGPADGGYSVTPKAKVTHAWSVV